MLLHGIHKKNHCYKMKKRLYFLYLLLLFLGSCSQNHESERLEAALNLAGNNRQELEKVLRHYADDSLKYKAAVFLISNMPYHTYYEGTEIKKMQELYQMCSHHLKEEIPLVADSFIRRNGAINVSNLKVQNDITNINSALLTHHIDSAFGAWRHFPWGKNVSFDDFCEYVLPYRVGTEIPTKWRKDIMESWKPVTDSLIEKHVSNPIDVAKVVFEKLYQRHPVFSSQMPSLPSIGPRIINYNVGSCRDMCDIILYTFRALGIPCSKDFLLSGDYNTPHSWNNLAGKETWIDLASGTFLPASAYKDVKAKAFRESFALQANWVDELGEDKTEIPPLFRYPKFKDVTDVYADGQLMQEIVIEESALTEESDKSKPYYLCIPQKQKWIPVDYCILKNGHLKFRNFKAGTVICVAQYHHGEMRPSTLPIRTFLENRKAKLVAFKPEKKLAEAVFFTKFPPIDEPFLKNMIGSVVEGANHADFSDADTLVMIKQAPSRLCSEVLLPSTKTYRYIRYRGADGTHCDIAELSFYNSSTDTIRLKGEVIGNGDKERTEQAKALDGDLYTSYSSKAPSGSWVGLKFSKPEMIKKVILTPRNRDNFIRRGDLYELYYWDHQKWCSLGAKEATSDNIIFNVPKSSLLYLKDLTRGNQERIFEYKNGKQVWW